MWSKKIPSLYLSDWWHCYLVSLNLSDRWHYYLVQTQIVPQVNISITFADLESVFPQNTLKKILFHFRLSELHQMACRGRNFRHRHGHQCQRHFGRQISHQNPHRYCSYDGMISSKSSRPCQDQRGVNHNRNTPCLTSTDTYHQNIFSSCRVRYHHPRHWWLFVLNIGLNLATTPFSTENVWWNHKQLYAMYTLKHQRWIHWNRRRRSHRRAYGGWVIGLTDLPSISHQSLVGRVCQLVRDCIRGASKQVLPASLCIGYEWSRALNLYHRSTTVRYHTNW